MVHNAPSIYDEDSENVSGENISKSIKHVEHAVKTCGKVISDLKNVNEKIYSWSQREVFYTFINVLADMK